MAAIDTLPGRPAGPAAGLADALRNEFTLKGARLPWAAKIYLLCVVIPIGLNAGPLVVTTLRGFLMVMVIPLTVMLFSKRFGKLFITDYLFLGHICWAALALHVNNPDKFVQQVGSVGVEFLGGYLIGRAYIRTPEAFIALCRWLCAIVLLTLPFDIFEARTGRPLLIEFIRRIPGVVTVEMVNADKRMGLERVQAVFAHPIHYGLFCSVAFSLSFVALQGLGSTAWRLLRSTLVALSGFLALSSGALLAMVLQFALIIWSTLLQSVRQRWWILVGLFALAYVVIDVTSTRSPIRVFMSYATFSAHNAYWRGIIFEWGMKNVWANPWVGIGLNDWERPWYMFSGSMDNFWLVMAVRYGIPGFLMLAVGWAYGVAMVMRRNLEGDERLTLIRRAWVFTFLGLSFTLCTVHVWTNIYSFAMFMFGAGMWLITAEPRTGEAGEGAAPPPPGLRQGRARQDAPAIAPTQGPRPGPRHSRFPLAARPGSARSGERPDERPPTLQRPHKAS
ncbi:O-antigen ligase family protein [Rubellimicrobium aerolatum]|uniref:O-antigen ligase family protein n=1 Tax=Rubellimicrobium aerolatum TaxID=490979 RepID=A0ABW0S9E5_9RHOB|nr:O-antigen ligase family protein [Rubellimicrobium aerolatum]MBP1804922.1 O-antigen ligase [Rubellimicrobium aerolatum]